MVRISLGDVLGRSIFGSVVAFDHFFKRQLIWGLSCRRAHWDAEAEQAKARRKWPWPRDALRPTPGLGVPQSTGQPPGLPRSIAILILRRSPCRFLGVLPRRGGGQKSEFKKTTLVPQRQARPGGSQALRTNTAHGGGATAHDAGSQMFNRATAQRPQPCQAPTHASRQRASRAARRRRASSSTPRQRRDDVTSRDARVTRE